jgi:hypothetical protein
MSETKTFEPVSAPFKQPKELRVNENFPYTDGFTVRISSDNRLSGDSLYPHTHFTYALKVPRPSTGPDFNRVACLSASIPKTWWTVDVSTGNTFVLQELGVNSTITVPPGNYDVVQWCSQIPPLMTAASTAMGHGWTYKAVQQLKPDTGFIIYSVTGNAGHQPSIIINAQGSLDAQVGFDANTINVFINSSITTTQVYCAQGEFSVLLRSDCCAADGDDTLCSVLGTNLVAPKSVIVYQSQDFILNSRRFDRSRDGIITFNITSASTGNYFDTHGYPVTFDLKFFYVEMGHLTALTSIYNTQQLMLEEAKATRELQTQMLEELKQMSAFFSTLKGNLALSTTEPDSHNVGVTPTSSTDASTLDEEPTDVAPDQESKDNPRAGEEQTASAPAEETSKDPRAGEDVSTVKAGAGKSHDDEDGDLCD